MSVNLSQPATRKRHWVFSLWPLLLFALLLALGARLAWHYWPQLLLQSVVWQKVCICRWPVCCSRSKRHRSKPDWP